MNDYKKYIKPIIMKHDKNNCLNKISIDAKEDLGLLLLMQQSNKNEIVSEEAILKVLNEIK